MLQHQVQVKCCVFRWPSKLQVELCVSIVNYARHCFFLKIAKRSATTTDFIFNLQYFKEVQAFVYLELGKLVFSSMNNRFKWISAK